MSNIKKEMLEIETEYYTPDISELFLGYECEQQTTCKGKECKWITIKLNHISPFTLQEKIIRTPYLTKEQIEAEGWQFKSDMYSDEFGNGWVIEFTKNKYFFSFNQDYFAHIYSWTSKEGSHTIFRGEIKSINEFRTIIKLGI